MEFLFIDEKANRYRMKIKGNADKKIPERSAIQA